MNSDNAGAIVLPKGKARTIPALKAFNLPEGKDDAIVWDAEMPGFGLRLRRTADGVVCTWIYQYRFHGRSRRFFIAKVDEILPTEALDKAKDLRAQVRLGHDPQQEREDKRRENAKKEKLHTLLSLAQVYLDSRHGDVRDRSLAGITRYLTARRYFGTIHSIDITAITRRDIALCINEITKNSGKLTAIQARSALSSFFRWCMTQGLAETNPVIGTAAPKKPDPRAGHHPIDAKAGSSRAVVRRAGGQRFLELEQGQEGARQAHPHCGVENSRFAKNGGHQNGRHRRPAARH
jgi:hypothetical protein